MQTGSQVKTTPTWNRIVVREVGGRIIYLMLGYLEGNLEQVVGMRVANVPRKWESLKKLRYSNIVQTIIESGLDGQDELEEAMNPYATPISKIIYFKKLEIPLEITP